MNEHQQFKTVLDILVHTIFPAIVFAVGAKMGMDSFIEQMKRWKLLAKVFLLLNVAIPLVVAGALKIADIPVAIEGILLIFAVSAGDSFALLETRDKKGQMGLSMFLLAALCLTMPFTVPFWIWVFRQWFDLPFKGGPFDIVRFVIPLTLVPMAAGMLLGKYLRTIALKLAVVADWYSRVLLLVVGVGALVLGFEGLSHYTFWSLAVVFILISLMLFAGYFTGGENTNERVSIALTASLGNMAVVLIVAKSSDPRGHYLAQIVGFVIFRWLVIMGYYLVFRRSLGFKKSG